MAVKRWALFEKLQFSTFCSPRSLCFILLFRFIMDQQVIPRRACIIRVYRYFMKGERISIFDSCSDLFSALVFEIFWSSFQMQVLELLSKEDNWIWNFPGARGLYCRSACVDKRGTRFCLPFLLIHLGLGVFQIENIIAIFWLPF